MGETISAGTEVKICVVCSDSSGTTATFVNVPHPTWTDANGNAVVLLNAVALGGPNGLNS